MSPARAMPSVPLAAWALFALLAASGLATSEAAYDPNAPKLVWAFALLGSALAAHALALGLGRAGIPRARHSDGWVLAAFAAATLCALVSDYPWFAAPALRDAALAVLAYGSARFAFAGGRVAPLLDRTLAGLTGVACLYGLARLLDPAAPWLVAPGGWHVRRLTSTLGNQDTFAAWLLIALPFIMRGHTHSRRWRPAWAVAGLLAVVCLALTVSRAAWIAFAVQAAAWRLGGRARRRLPLRLFAAAALAAVAVLAVLPGLTAKLGSASTFRQRLVIWDASARMALARPFTGHGPGAFGAAFPEFRSPDYRASGLSDVNEFAHDLPLHVAATGGIAGLLALALGLVVLVREAGVGGSSGRSTEPEAAPHSLAILGVLVQNLFSVTLCVTPIVATLAVVWGAAEDDAPPATPARSPVACAALLMLAMAAAWGATSAGRDFAALCHLRSARLAIDEGLSSGGFGWEPGAIRELEGALAARPGCVPARYRLAGVRALSGDLPRALASYIMVEALSPGFAELPRNRAEVSFAAGALDAARKQARRWHDMNRRDPAGPVLMAKVELAAGNHAAARENALLAKDLGAPGPAVEALLEALRVP
ncbi:MAG: O-antigen ligase family protein [Candidatus Wallbacteria bacterium]|nr:O-antigen ligase family protein [Candidatus Wallbacteria bacterium]